MNAFTPTPVDSFANVSALLTVLTDPNLHKQRLDELVAQQKLTEERIEALNKMADETRRLNSSAQALTIVSENRSKALDAREAEVDEREKNLQQSEARHSEAALRHREGLVEARENAVKAKSARLSAMRTDLEGRLRKIANLASSLG